MAMRTLGFAFKIVEDTDTRDCVELVADHDLSFLGVVAISDPIRQDACGCFEMPVGRYRYQDCNGDTPGTATEIARQIGLWKPGRYGT